MDSRRKFVTTMSKVAGGLALTSSRILGANDRIRLGMIGPGFRGLQLIWSMRDPNAEFVAFADAYSARLDAAKLQAKAPAAKTYVDYRDLLADKSIDAVIIATPQHLHCEHFVAALQAGKHVYQEKTMAFSVDHAKRMRAAHRNAPKLTVQIGHQDCSSIQVTDALGFLKDDKVGKITEIHSHMYRNTPHGKPQWTRPIPPDMTPENVAWKAFLGGAPDRDFDANRFLNWRLFWDYSGGNFYENMSHQLCFWYKVLDLKIPIKVCTNGGVFLWKDGREVPDTMDALMVHSEDLMVTWDSGFGNSELGTTEDVLGTDGTISRGRRCATGRKRSTGPKARNSSARAPTSASSISTSRTYRISWTASAREKSRTVPSIWGSGSPWLVAWPWTVIGSANSCDGIQLRKRSTLERMEALWLG